MGNFSQSAATFFETAGIAFSFPRMISVTSCAISTASPSFMPRAVTAGVPIRTPLVINGEVVSNGIVF